MGLLDIADDPLMGLATGLLSASGPSRMPVSLGQALGAGVQGMNETRQNGMMSKMRQTHFDQMKQQQADNDAKRSALMQIREQLPEQVKPMFDVNPEGFLAQLNKAQEEYTLTPGAVRYRGAQKIAEAPREEKIPEGMRFGPNGELTAIPGYVQMKSQIAAAGRPVQSTNVFNNTKDDFKNERDLRNDFAGLPTTKAYKEVQSAYDQINVALKQQSPAGDLAAATKIMKILDPGSVVRESELGMAMAATGALDRVSNYAQMLVSGQKLTPTQRKDFGDLASKLYGAASERYNASVGEYQGIAKDYGLKADRVAKPSETPGKTITLADIQETARASGKTTAEVTAAAKAKGYTIK